MKKLLTLIAIASIIAACNGKANTNAQAALNSKNYKDSLRLDSFKRSEAVNKEIDKRAAEAKVTANTTQVVHHSGTSVQNSASVNTTTKKKGWSSAAKGAVIGGVVGAGAGILIDKKDARGAIIGGVAGAGAGYAIGRANDRKTGRVQPKN